MTLRLWFIILWCAIAHRQRRQPSCIKLPNETIFVDLCPACGTMWEAEP